jgi:hypothetical protein
VFDFYRLLPVDVVLVCQGVTAGKDKIYIGGYIKVIILNIDGSLVREISTDGVNYNLLYNERNDQLLLRQGGRLCCINLDGHVIYTYDISGDRGGLAVDQQGHVYICGADDIHRLSPDGTFRDIVLSKHDGVDEPWSITTSPIFILLSFVLLVVLINCMEFSHGRVTTALSVHGTTVIPQGSLVNDISSS